MTNNQPLHIDYQNIFLVGMMGSWKTTVGRMLAKRLDWKFIDLDDKIEAAAGLIIAHIFEVFSEEEFRVIEAEQLEQVAQNKAQVVGTGGGAVLSEENRFIFRNRGYTIFLRAKPAILAGRIRDKSRRPLLKQSKDVVGTLSDIWLLRKRCYEASAHFILDTDELSPVEVTDHIVDHLKVIYARDSS